MSEIPSKVPPLFPPFPPLSRVRLAHHHDVDFVDDFDDFDVDVDVDDVDVFDDEECVANREILDKFVQ